MNCILSMDLKTLHAVAHEATYFIYSSLRIIKLFQSIIYAIGKVFEGVKQSPVQIKYDYFFHRK